MNTKKEELAGPALAALGELARSVAAARRAAGDPIGAVAAGWVGPNYLLSLQAELAARPEGPERFKLLRQATGEALAIQRGDVWSGRLELDREKLEFRRKQHRDKLKLVNKLAVAAGKLPGPKGKWRDPNAPMTDEELKACVDKVDEIMGLK